VRISGSNAGYTMFRGSVKSTGYPLHPPVSPSLPLPCVTVCHHISTGLSLQNIRPLHSSSYLFATAAVQTVTRRGCHLQGLANNEMCFLFNKASGHTDFSHGMQHDNSAISLAVCAKQASLPSVTCVFILRNSEQMSKLLTGRSRVT